jgi:hypothetical protein
MDETPLAVAMQFPTSGLERAPKILISQNISIRTKSARSRASEKKALGENEPAFKTVGVVQSLVRKILQLLEILRRRDR